MYTPDPEKYQFDRDRDKRIAKYALTFDGYKFMEQEKFTAEQQRAIIERMIRDQDVVGVGATVPQLRCLLFTLQRSLSKWGLEREDPKNSPYWVIYRHIYDVLRHQDPNHPERA